MALISGQYRETNIATIAALITLINAHLTAENARMIALGGAATSIIATLTLTIRATNGAGDTYAHKITTTFNCPTLADTATQTAALSVFATAVETESSFTTVTEVDVAMTLTMSN